MLERGSVGEARAERPWRRCSPIGRCGAGGESTWRSSIVIGAGAIGALNVSGGSFNAARRLGPTIVASQFPFWWVYLIAPTLGGVFGALCCGCLSGGGAPPE